eukprot:365896-Chlamydomonas_euryale.AAC.14
MQNQAQKLCMLGTLLLPRYHQASGERPRETIAAQLELPVSNRVDGRHPLNTDGREHLAVSTLIQSGSGQRKDCRRGGTSRLLINTSWRWHVEDRIATHMFKASWHPAATTRCHALQKLKSLWHCVRRSIEGVHKHRHEKYSHHQEMLTGSGLAVSSTGTPYCKRTILCPNHAAQHLSFGGNTQGAIQHKANKAAAPCCNAVQG